MEVHGKFTGTQNGLVNGEHDDERLGSGVHKF